MLPIHALLASCVLATTAVSQQTPRTLPTAAHDAWGNQHFDARTSILRPQFWFDGSHLPANYTIHEISLRLPRRLASAAYTANLVITLANTSLTPAGLSTTLNANLGSATPSFSSAISVPASAAATTPDQPVQWHVLQTPFTFTGPHLIIDMHYTSLSHPSGPIYVDGVTMWNSNTLHLTGSGSCGGTIVGGYVNGSLTVHSAGTLPAGQPVTLLAGLENVAAGGVALPWNLGPFGFPGCWLGVLPIVEIPAMTTAQGSVSFNFPVPPPARSVGLSTQLVHASAAGTTLLTTNTVHHVLGARGSFVFLGSVDGTTAPSVPGFNVAPVLMVR